MDISATSPAAYFPRTPPSSTAVGQPAGPENVPGFTTTPANTQTRAPGNALNKAPSNTPRNTSDNTSVNAQNEPAQARPRNANSQELSDEQRAQIAKLQSRDREVRAHESAHLAAAGGLARGGASFSYTVGPDNRRYAVGGEVSIDTSPADSPEKTIIKAQTIQAAALAPAKPSSQDSAVAASAAQMAAQARTEISAERAQETKDASAATQAEVANSYSSTAAIDGNNNGEGSTIDLMV